MKQRELRRVVDIGMTVLLLLQMAYQVMGEAAHEWLGMGMTALVIVHQALNRRWYGAMFKGRYTAYRAAGQADLKSYSLGVRLVRNAGAGVVGSATVSGGIPAASDGGRTLIAFFSWGGNTRGIAREIQRQTGFDLFEIEPIPAYSDDYNTVLMQAQRDQHAQARPEIAGLPENMDDYDTILLGYPNWWASIPMPIASFLEQYDFAGKRIIPFCSHGGGRFGQSLTAIAKLAPESNMGQGLSIHYSGGSRLSEDVAEWLETNHLNPEA